MKNRFVIVTDSSSYVVHYDRIEAIVGNQVRPPIISAAEHRRIRSVKGINSDVFTNFIENVLRSSISELDPCSMYLVLDKLNFQNV
ncbi:unnamed protein product [Rotaria sp. Silwood2]|nr:unnamed protein product [Rotaria sp. Silwood2]CAF4283808.1 unnamed protein product [Rotaria sp. Silwood2]